MKSDGLLVRNILKGMIGDMQNVILCGNVHNIRKILTHLGTLLGFLVVEFWKAVPTPKVVLETAAALQQAFTAA